MDNYTPIRVNNRVIGRVIDNTFEKRVHSSRHFLRTPPGIALDVLSLDRAEEAGASIVVIRDVDTNCVYVQTIKFIRQRAFKLDRGCGKQLCLPIGFWMVEGNLQQLELGL